MLHQILHQVSMTNDEEFSLFEHEKYQFLMNFIEIQLIDKFSSLNINNNNINVSFS